jgi:hypothetical protein
MMLLCALCGSHKQLLLQHEWGVASGGCWGTAVRQALIALSDHVTDTSNHQIYLKYKHNRTPLTFLAPGWTAAAETYSSSRTEVITGAAGGPWLTE